MQKNNNIIIKAALAVLSAVLATGCISEKYDMPDDLQSVMVRLDVSADAMTKATEEPTANEKAINSIRIYAYHGERLAGYFYRDHASTMPVYIDLRLPEEGVYNVDFYVVANEKSMTLRTDSPVMTSSMSKSQLLQVRFQALNNTSVNGVPMYGTASANIDVANLLKDEEGNEVPNTMEGHEKHILLNYQIPVSLARPLAKMSVYAAKISEGNLYIQDIRMLAKGTRMYGYLLPQSDETLNVIPSRANDRPLASDITVSKVVSSPTQNVADYEDITAGGIYLAEVPVGSENWSTPVASDVRSSVLQITFSTGPGLPVRTTYVYMPRIERNKHYKVLCSVSPEGNISLNYVVSDWDDAVMWTGGLTFDYPSHSFLYPDLSATPSSADAVMTTTAPFVGYFKLEKPEYETFNPTILDGLAADYKVEVYDGETLLTNSDEYVAADKWYTIKVTPTRAENAGKAVRLAITYQASWSAEAEFLMINGSSPNFVWPYGGSEFMQDSNYVIITQQ